MMNVMRFELDPRKSRAHWTKHGVDFADAIGALEDDRALTIRHEHPDEEWWLTTGTDFLGRVLVVCYTVREETIRLISARKATARERQEYESLEKKLRKVIREDLNRRGAA